MDCKKLNDEVEYLRNKKTTPFASRKTSKGERRINVDKKTNNIGGGKYEY